MLSIVESSFAALLRRGLPLSRVSLTARRLTLRRSSVRPPAAMYFAKICVSALLVSFADGDPSSAERGAHLASDALETEAGIAGHQEGVRGPSQLRLEASLGEDGSEGGANEEEHGAFVSFFAEAGKTTTLLVSVSTEEGARAARAACANERVVNDLPKVGVLVINVLDENVESAMEELRNTPGVKHVERDGPVNVERDGPVHSLPHLRGGGDEGWGWNPPKPDFYGVAQVQSAAMVNQAKKDRKTPTKVPKVSATCSFVHVSLLFLCTSTESHGVVIPRPHWSHLLP